MKKKVKKFLNKIKFKPYIIAEIGVNHEGSIIKAKKMISEAKSAGANAVKFQTYKANLLASKNSPAYWDLKKEKTKNQYELFKKFDSFDQKEYKILSKYCIKKKIDFLSTPFDLPSVDFLNPLVPYFKIASADITNLPLLEKIGKKRKIIFLSTGASNLKEIKKALNILKKNGCPLVVLLHCILNYPTDKKNANLNMILHLKKNFKNNIVGYSDHTLPDKFMQSITTAYLLGAQVIEKHFTFNKKIKGNDHYHSMNKKDLKVLREHLDMISLSMGRASIKKPISSEFRSRLNARRSITLIRNIKKNEKIKKNDLISKRPGTGISPMFFYKIIGKRAKTNLQSDHILKWKDLK